MFGPNLQEIWDALPEERRQRIEEEFQREKALYIASQPEENSESAQQ
mgnify:CR=1 FL=1